MRNIFFGFLTAAFAVLGSVPAQAQLVADSEIAVLDGIVTNVPSSITVGTNGPFTYLILTNSTILTNTGSITIGVNAGANSNSVIVDGSAVQSTGTFSIGSVGSFNQLLITNGGVVSDNMGAIGLATSSSNNCVLVTGAGSRWSNRFDVRIGSTGHDNQLIITNGGTVIGGNTTVGSSSSGIPSLNSATVTGTGSVWKTSSLTVSGGNTGGNQLFVTNGGTVSNSGNCTIGVYSSTNSIVVTGPGAFFTNGQTITVGYVGPGNQFTISNGAVVATDNTYVSDNGGAREKLVVTGTSSLLTNRTDFYVGRFGSTNEFLLSDGGTVADTDGYINGNADLALVTGPTTQWTNRSDLFLGGSRCLLVVSNGAKVFDIYGYIGNAANSSNNTMIVTDPGSRWINLSEIYVGYSGSGNQLIATNGSTVIAKKINIGFAVGSSNNVLTVSGGSVFATNFTSGQLNILHGGVVLNSGLLRTDQAIMNNGASSQFTFNGGTLQALNTQCSKGSPFIVGDGTSAATFEMLPTGSHSFPNGLVISNNAVLKGFGTVFGTVSVNGSTIAPGTTNFGFITFNSSLVLNSDSTLFLKLRPSTGAADNIQSPSPVTYGGMLQLTNVQGSYGNGSSFKICTASAYNGSFAAINPVTPAPGLKWNTNQLNVDGTLRIFSTNTPPPTIASTTVSGSDVVMTATGGIPYDPCYLLSTTNLAAPIATWEHLATNKFDASGNIALTNAILPGDPARFFLLQVE